MKVVNKLRLWCSGCRQVRRGRKVYVVCALRPRHKQRQGQWISRSSCLCCSVYTKICLHLTDASCCAVRLALLFRCFFGRLHDTARTFAAFPLARRCTVCDCHHASFHAVVRLSLVRATVAAVESLVARRCAAPLCTTPPPPRPAHCCTLLPCPVATAAAKSSTATAAACCCAPCSANKRRRIVPTAAAGQLHQPSAATEAAAAAAARAAATHSARCYAKGQSVDATHSATWTGVLSAGIGGCASARRIKVCSSSCSTRPALRFVASARSAARSGCTACPRACCSPDCVRGCERVQCRLLASARRVAA